MNSLAVRRHDTVRLSSEQLVKAKNPMFCVLCVLATAAPLAL